MTFLTDDVVVDQVTPAIEERPGSTGRQATRRMAWLVAALLLGWAAVAYGPEAWEWWGQVSTTWSSPDHFRGWVEEFGFWAPIVFLLAQAVQVIVVPIPGTLFPPVGALAFGPWPALGLSLAGMALGSAVVFLVVRRWGRPLAERLVGRDRVDRYGGLLAERGGLLLWLVFLIPLLPDDAVCALAGLSGISFRRFMLIATVGRLPALIAGVFATAGLADSPLWLRGVAVAAVLLLFWAGSRYGQALEARLLRLSEGARLTGDAGGGHRAEFEANRPGLPPFCEGLRGGSNPRRPSQKTQHARNKPVSDP